MKKAFVALALLGAATTPLYAEPLDHFKTRDDIGINKVPHLGESHVLVIPTRVGESTFPAARLAQLQKIFDPAGGPGTFRHYWQTVSNGRYDPIPTLAAPLLYPDRCPLPNTTVANCKITFTNISAVADGGVKIALADMLSRVRDEQQIDLAQFDVNAGSGPGEDGYFDGLLFDSDIISGVGAPLEVLNLAPDVATQPGGGGRMIRAGVAAMAPPELHEFGHNLGFVDLYNGPPVNCLMADTTATLGAFSRQQIGWGDVETVTATKQITLAPVLDGGKILRIGAGPQYLLVENRGGAHHAALESWPAGINVYAVDETKLPAGTFGFLDVTTQSLYFPNEQAPYLFVNWPINCKEKTIDADDSCVLTAEGTTRVLTNQDGTTTGFTLTIGKTAADGSIELRLDDGTSEGCAIADAASTRASALLLLLAFAAVGLLGRRRRRH